MILKFMLTGFEEKMLHLCLTAFLILMFILLCLLVFSAIAALFFDKRR